MKFKDIHLQGFGEYVHQRYDVLTELADCCRDMKDLQEAADNYQEAIALNPGKPEAYTGLGYTAYEAGQAGPAGAAFQKALEISPGCPQALGGLGLVLLAQGDPAGAADMLSQAVAQLPQDKRLLAGLFRACWQSDQPARSAGPLGAYVRAHPGDGDFVHCLAMVCIKTGQIDQARRLLIAATAQAPDHAGCRELLAKLTPQPQQS